MNKNHCLAVVLLALCACGGPSTVSVPDVVTLQGEQNWYGVIGPLVAARCAVCHREGDIAPFSLENYDEVMAMLPTIRHVVADGIMPPFPPDQSDASGCPKIDDVRQMSANERAALLAWIDAGAPAGTMRELPAAKPNKPLGDPSDRWQMPQPYTSKVTTGDDYRCFFIRATNLTQIPVAAVSVEPGQRSIVHHAAVFLVPPDQFATLQTLEAADPEPGYDCFGGIGLDTAYPAGIWVPGNDAPIVPPGSGVGYYLPPGWGWVLQVHYNLHADAAPDQSTVVLWRGDLVITQVPHAIIAGNVAFSLPPNSETTITANAIVTDKSQTPTLNQGVEGRIYAVWGHEHLHGKSVQLDLVHSDGTEQCLLHIPKWDFHWQSIYRLHDFVSAKAGDQLRLRCDYLNTGANAVHYGEGTADEMCFAAIAALDP